MNGSLSTLERKLDIRQVANKDKYDLAASSYDFIAYLMSLGQATRLYEEVANRVDLPSGGTLVELGCGPASVIPSILKNTDKSSEIVGIDFSSKMIDIANRKKENNGWHNVRFECMDMYEYSPSKVIDTVVFCLALTAMPDYEKALEKALSILKPGGQLLIIDSFPLHTKWYHPISNIYIYLKSMVVGAKPVGKIINLIREKTDDFENQEMVLGVYTLIDTRKRQA
jgi:demethylmenaquinone methyltransferase/2-methoxy-6-polyprenyl-1,4-benzoquinol methylase